MIGRLTRAWRERRDRQGFERDINEKARILAAKNFRPEASVIITGDPRGGTTWLMETLAAWPGTAVNWEPLHHELGVIPAQLRWGKRPFIPENDRDPERMAILRAMLTCQRTTEWTMRYCSAQQAESAERVLTKFVRANLLLPWMTAVIPFERKPVLLRRHPVPTVLSQMKAFVNPARSNPVFTVPDQINPERFIEHLDHLNGLQPGLERQLALWCLNNRSTLEHQRHGRDWLVVYYEDLLDRPEIEIERIAESWRVDPAPMIAALGRNKASATDFTKDLRATAQEQATKWMSRIDDHQRLRLQAVLDHYGVDEYDLSTHAPKRQR